MALERIGLGGVLTFDEKKALAGMGRASKGFANLKRGAASVGAGLSQVSGGLRNTALALAPITAGLAVGLKVAAGFEKQMSAVGAITRANSQELAELTAEAKRLGVESVFSAQESAEAMEALGRAGFNNKQIISGLGGVMNAAAAEGIDLATSADIIAQSVKIMGLEAEDAAHNADVLALASAKSNTNIVALGESLKFGGLTANAAGLSIEEVTAVFGKLADAGLRGSIAGTSFASAIDKLNKPSSKAAGIIKDLGIKTRGAGGRLLKMPRLVENLKAGLAKLTDEGERNAAITELFGKRGQRAYLALSKAGGAALQELTDDLNASSFGIGAAAEAAEKRLDNFLGAIKLFGSSLEAATIEFFGPFLSSFKETVQDMTSGLNDVLFAIQKLKQAEDLFGLAADNASGAAAKGISQQLQLSKRLEGRQASQARAAIQALTREKVGNENLSRSAIQARNKSFAQFIRTGLVGQKLSKKQFSERRSQLDRITERIENGTLSERAALDLRQKVIQSITNQSAVGRKMGNAAKARHDRRIRQMIEQQALQARITAEAESLIDREKKLNEIEQKHGTTARLIAEGVLDAIKTIKDAFETVVLRIKDFGRRLERAIGKERLRQFAKIATIAVIIAGVIAPLIVAFLGFAFVVKSLFIIFVGLGKIAVGAFFLIKGAIGVVIAALGTLAPVIWPIIAVLAILTIAFLAFRREGETVGETFTRLWATIIKPFFDGFLAGFDRATGGAAALWERFSTGMSKAWDDSVGDIIEAFSTLQAELQGLWVEIFGQADAASTNTKNQFFSIGEVVGEVVGFIAEALAAILQFGVANIGPLVKILTKPFTTMIAVVRDVVEAFKELWKGNFLVFLTRIGRAATRILTLPFKIMMEGILRLLQALPDDVVSKFVDPGTIKAMEKFAKFGFQDPPPIKQIIETATKGETKVKGPRGRRGRIDIRTRDEKFIARFVKMTERQNQVAAVLQKQNLQVNKANVIAARNALRTKATKDREEIARQEKVADKELQANVNIKDERTTNVKTDVCIDGRVAGKALAKHKQSIFDRSGGVTEPFNRLTQAQTGVAPSGRARTG